MISRLHQQIIAKGLDVAKVRRESAGFGGEIGDRGASTLEVEIAIWAYGLKGEIPPQFKEIERLVLQDNDPDYPKYLELKKRFEK